ncbi:crossover junction endodeoxyribonuclease RuvC [Halieaceae bacterium IMCC14734]|uniref:Crossover junction endodeoxyribonuclease RuvC n=1 Tax=Candidatus Litorirhabdus singularis TaxID=2518993 RepID=A0ABT3TAM9_9GAMM|nr:crossover junction endodeoxyribonuclease RuvC [Candidatus Litorirhabdus singularis]MCX2979331.1 crossover junction endodeoxyribonuclease RuvC [Candidatus Litorirhabdus singularis]
MTLILGIDPGSQKTGFGIINQQGSRAEYVTSGIIRLPRESLPARLKIIFDNVSEIIAEYAPQEFAIEEVFMARDPKAAIKLGQARGAAIVAAVNADLPVFEYAAKSIKQAVVGTGAADKAQVQHMVKSLLKLPTVPPEDAADALAVALCHAHTHQSMIKLAGARTSRRGRAR